MAAMMDKMIADQEAHETRLRDEALASFKTNHNGQFVNAFVQIDTDQHNIATARRSKVVDALCKRMWEVVLGGKRSDEVRESVAIEGDDCEYFRENGDRLVREGLGISDSDLGVHSGVVRFVVRVREDNKGPGSSGWTFLEALVTRT